MSTAGQVSVGMHMPAKTSHRLCQAQMEAYERGAICICAVECGQLLYRLAVAHEIAEDTLGVGALVGERQLK
jgi:hypothetical protein